MQKSALDNLEKSFNEQKIVLENGLTVLVCEMPEYQGIYASYGTNYGSTITKFTLGDKQYNLPAGVAHFLEHKMFENEEGVDAFTLYAKTGASANAFTSFDKTCYIFGATNSFDESLDILLSFVSKPFFTKETIEKEQGIIGQEIQMYNDNPGWRMMFAILNGLYHNSAIKDDIAGTIESISEITPEILYACTNAFYRPQNMCLCVAGNISAQRVLDACNRANIPTYTEPVEVLTVTEPKQIKTKYSELEMSVSQPILGVGYKEIPTSKQDICKTEIICDILTEIICGDSSQLYCDLYDQGLINGGFGGEYLRGDGYLAVFFTGETKNPKLVEKALKDEINKLKTDGIDEELFIATKNVLFGEIIASLEKVEDTALAMSNSFMCGCCRFDEAKTLASLSLQDVQNALNDMLNEEFCATVIINPK